MTEEDERLGSENENQPIDDGDPATINMVANNGADYQAQIAAEEHQREREINERNKAQVESRRRIRYEKTRRENGNDDSTNAFDKNEIENERKDLTYSRSPTPPQFMGGSGVTTFNDIRYPTAKENKVAAKTPVEYSESYIPHSITPPAYNPGAYSTLGKNYFRSKKQQTTVQSDAGKFIATPEYKTLSLRHKENVAHQSGVLDFMNPNIAAVYSPTDAKNTKLEPVKRIKENPESYSILGSKYFSQTKAGETQRKKVQTKSEAFQGTTQYANRLGITFSQVAVARTEREKQEATLAKANAKPKGNVGIEASQRYIPTAALSGGLSYFIPQVESKTRRDETKQEGGATARHIKSRKTGKNIGMMAPASEKKDPQKIVDMIKGKGISQEVLQQREESKRAKAAEKRFKESLPPRSTISKLDPIVDAGMGSYFKPKDIASHTIRKTKLLEEKAAKTRNEALRLQRRESLEHSEREDKIQSEAKEASVFNIALSLSHDVMAKEQQASQSVESKRQLQQQSDAYKDIAKQAGVFAKGATKAAEEETKNRAAHKRENPKWLERRAERFKPLIEGEPIREKAYRKNTPILNQLTDAIGGSKGKKPYNYNKTHGEGGIFDKTVEQPVFDKYGNEVGRSFTKVNTVEEFGKRHPVMSAFGSHVKQEARRPLDDLLAGRKARAEDNRRGFFYGGGLQPVNITKTNPEGEFPKKSGRPVASKRKDPVGGRELAFFGKPFGAPKAPRRTRRGKVIKMTAAQRKRASRAPKTFLDSVFGSKW